MALAQLEPEAARAIEESIRNRATLGDWLFHLNTKRGMPLQVVRERMAIVTEHYPKPKSRRRRAGRLLAFPTGQ